MRQRLQVISEQARDALLGWHDELQAMNGLSDEEAAIRYATQHRGRPDAIMAFVRQAAPDGKDVLDAAVEYEATMERELRQRRRHGS